MSVKNKKVIGSNKNKKAIGSKNKKAIGSNCTSTCMLIEVLNQLIPN
jgi:hypothetical protein